MATGLTITVPTTYLFEDDHSGPDLLQGLDCKATEELIRILLSALEKFFSIKTNPELILLRKQVSGVGPKDSCKIVVVGARIMGQLVPYLGGTGLCVKILAKGGGGIPS